MNRIHVSDTEMNLLALTAAAGDFAVEDLVGAACRDFAGHEESFQEYWLREVWVRPARPVTRRRTLGEKLYGLARRLFPALGTGGPPQAG